MAKYVPVIDSSGQFTRRKRSWVDKHAEAGNGEWREGTFVFHRTCTERAEARAEMKIKPAAYGEPGTRAAALLGRQWAQKDTREFPVDTHFWDGRAVLKFWGTPRIPGKQIQPGPGL